MDTAAKRLVSIPEARQLLGGIGHTTVYELIKRSEIVKVNIGRRGFITSESLEAYMDRLSAASVGGDVGVTTDQRPNVDQMARDPFCNLGLVDDDRTEAPRTPDAEEVRPS